jgi:hypothetical protein
MQDSRVINDFHYLVVVVLVLLLLLLLLLLQLLLGYYLSIGSTAIVDLGRRFSFLIHIQSVGLLGRGISPSQGHYLHTDIHASSGMRTH